MEQTSRITIPEKNLAKMVTALLDSGHWIKTEKLFDEKVLVIIRKDEN